MKISRFHHSLSFLILLPFLAPAQAPYANFTCDQASRICSGQTYTYTAWTGNNPAQSGPYYGCLTSRPGPAWFYFIAGNTGDVHITISSEPCKDIDFICWGPFDSLYAGCNGGLVQNKVIDCSFNPACIEVCDFPSMVAGKTYILLITNYSQQACAVSFSQSSGSGEMLCLQPPVTSNNGPLCAGQTIHLTSTLIPGGNYAWTGPNGFTSTQQNPSVPNITPANSGIYSLVVTVGTIVLGPVSTTVTVHPTPQLQIIPDTTICSGSAISIGGSFIPGNTYTWASSPGGYTSSQANPSVQPNANTTYLLTVTSSQNCSITAGTTITVNPSPSVYVLPNTSICEGLQLSLGGNPNPLLNFSWISNPPGFTSSSSNPLVSPSISTIYTLVVSNQQECSRTYTVTVNVNPTPAAITGPDQIICADSVISIGITGVPGNNYNWTSVPPGFISQLATVQIHPITSTTYYLTETHPAGCSNSNSVTITVNPLPAAVTGPPQAVCKYSPVTIGSPPVTGTTYHWISDPPGYTSVSSNPTVAPTVTTIYTLTQTIQATGCSAANSVTITVNPLPDISVIPSTSICIGNSIQIGGNEVPGNTYLWSSYPAGFNSTLANPTVAPVVTTIYTLTQKITATSCSKSAIVTITVNPLPVADAGQNQTTCAGIPVTIGSIAVPGYNYNWTSSPPGFSSTLSNPIVSPSLTTTYYLLVTHSGSGCSASQQVKVTVNPGPLPGLQAFTPVCKSDQAFLLTGGSPAGGTYSGQGVNNGMFFPSSVLPGIYDITYTYSDAQGCTGSAVQPIEVLNKPSLSGSIKYLNTSQSPLDNCRVFLLGLQGNVLDSIQTDAQGLFEFNCLESGIYSIKTTSWKSWGGGNSIDALLVLRYSVGLITFTELQKKLADLNLNISINSVDAYLIVRRWTGIINNFAAGTWHFPNNDTIISITGDVNINLTAICYGDLDASYLPLSGNKAPGNLPSVDFTPFEYFLPACLIKIFHHNKPATYSICPEP